MSEVAEGDLDGAAAHAEELTANARRARASRISSSAFSAMRDGGYAKARDEFDKVTGNAAAEIARAPRPRLRATSPKARPTMRMPTSSASSPRPKAFAPSPNIMLAVIEDLAGRPKEALDAFRGGQPTVERRIAAHPAGLRRASCAHRANGRRRRKIYARLPQEGADPSGRASGAGARSKAGVVPDRVIASAKQGLAETFYGIASSLSDETFVEIPVFYLQLALALDPRHELALSLLADRWRRPSAGTTPSPPTAAFRGARRSTSTRACRSRRICRS